jgi:hypothetical protein
VRVAPVVIAALLWSAACREVQPPPVTPVDEAAASAFGADLQAALAPCEAARVDALFDYETMAQLALAGLRLAPAHVETFQRKIGASGLGSRLCGTKQRPVKYRYLGARPRDGERWPLFRLDVDGAFNYVAFRPTRSRDGRVLAADTYMFRHGERGSETMRELLETFGVRPGSELKAAAASMRRFREALAKGDYDEARRVYAEMPPRVRQTKYLMGHAVAMAVSADERQRAMDAFAARFPGDPSLDLILLDGHTLNKDYDAVLATVDRIDRAVGGDPYLEMQRSAAYVNIGDLDRALQAAKSGVERVPADVHMWSMLMTVQLDRKDIAAALTTIQHLETHFDRDLSDEFLAEDPAWTALIASPEWKKQRAAQ